ncbi:hypothetical protein [Nostoc sp. LEGE 06077]|nr:hypothetical protein [Nostoc sp. LEGE 06077]
MTFIFKHLLHDYLTVQSIFFVPSGAIALVVVWVAAIASYNR